jgi:hypothetical protein
MSSGVHLARGYFKVSLALPIFEWPGIAGGESGSAGTSDNAPYPAETRRKEAPLPWAWGIGRSTLL